MRGGRLVLVDLERGSYRELAPVAGEPSSGKEAGHGVGHLSAAPTPTAHEMAAQSLRRTRGLRPVPAQALDPWAVSHDWPDKWRAYLHEHFRSHMAVAQAFQVSERAARKWWEGDGSCRADKAAVAMALHPDTAPQMLFGLAGQRGAA